MQDQTLSGNTPISEDSQKIINRFNALIDCAELILIELNTTGIITFVNKKACDTLGYKESEILGKNWFENFLPERIKNEILPISQKLLSGKIKLAEYYENPILTKSGDERIIYWHNALVKDKDGNIIGHLSSGEDITERKKIDNLIKASEEKFRIIADFTNDWEYWIDTKEQFIYTSPSCKNITGYEPNDFHSKPSLLEKIIHPDDIDIFLKHKHHLDKNGNRIPLSFRIINKNGETEWISHVCQDVFNDKGKLLGIRGSNRIVTEQKKQEQDLRLLNEMTEKALNLQSLSEIYDYIVYQLHEALPNTIILFNSIEVSKKETCFENVYGINHLLLEKVLKISRFNPIGKKYKLFPNYEHIYRNEKLFEFEHGLVEFSANQFPAIAAKAIEKLIGLHKIYTIGISKGDTLLASLHFLTFNKTEIKNANFIEAYVKQAGLIIQIKQAEQSLKEALETKDKFFSIIAHDLRSPFNAIIGFSDLLLEKNAEYDTEQRKNLIKPIVESSKNTFRLLENLLDWSRTEIGNIQFSPAQYKIEDIIIETIEEAQAIAKRKSIEIKYASGNSILASIDQAMFKTILRNLISNAIKFSPKNTSIEITLNESKKSINISVKDHGIGMSKEQIKKLFSLVDSESTRGTENEKGHGLGLVLCKEFINKHDGEIFVESKENMGSTFSFTIPKIL